MEYRQLGRSGVRVSALCLGAMNFGSGTEEATSIRIIQEALDLGINFIDTADVYAKGLSEEIVGKAIAQSGRRDEVVLATKGVAHLGEGPNDWGASRYHLTRACEASLRRLRTDRIDLYYLHIVDLTTPMDEIFNTLETVEQPPYSLLDRSIENELIWTCMRHGIGIVPFSPLAGGILSGKYRKGQKPPKGSRYEKAGPDDRRLTPEALDVVEKLGPIAEAKGISLSELAHAWLLQRPGITAPIIGPRTVEHLRSAIRACEVKLSEEELARIDEIVPPGSAVSDYYDVNVYARMRGAIEAGEVPRA